MKLPEPLFLIINPIIRSMLKSPLHGLMSDSLMLISFTGRKSGKSFTSPVRYIRDNNVVQCFTAKTNQWWKNVSANPSVTLRVQGKDYNVEMATETEQTEKIEAAIRALLKQFPADAPYYEIVLDSDRQPVDGDVKRAACSTVLVEASL